MAVTRDRDYPAERAQLFQTLNHAFDGCDHAMVLDVLANALIAGLGFYCRNNGLSLGDAKKYAQATCDNIVTGVEKNWDRPRHSDDVEVKPN